MTSYVRALYEFRGEPDSTEISITVGEVLTVTRLDVGDGWWEGRNARGEIGLFPAAYVEVMSASEVSQHQQGARQPMTEDYSATNRYDKTVDEFNDGDDWDDDWDDDNETYSEIGPAPLNQSKYPTNSGLTAQSSTNYDNQYLNTMIAVDDMQSSMLPAANNNNNSTTLKKSIMFGKSTDSYVLGSGNKNQIPETDMVQIVHVHDSYKWQANHDAYTVVVASPKKETKFKGMKTFIAYQLTPSFNNLSVSRRYKHFDWLHERLVEKFCLIPIPPLPDKQISGRYEEQFVEHRRVQLQEFVDWVCRHPVLSKCKVWHHFLTCTDGKIWKSGKRKAERDPFVGIEYCWAITSPEKQLLQSYVENQMESFGQFIHAMDSSVRNILSIASDVIKRYQSQSKKEFQRIGEGLAELSRALAIDEKRVAIKPSDTLLSESVANISNLFAGIAQQYGEQPKLDWIPFSDRLHIYRGILNTFPDILSTHKGAIQKRRECERLAGEQKVTNVQMAEANKRTDTISYAILAEMTHFHNERETHLKQTLKSLIDEEIKFYSTIVAQLQTASKYFE